MLKNFEMKLEGIKKEYEALPFPKFQKNIFDL